MKALIAYGTRYGATKGTSEEIGKILREKGTSPEYYRNHKRICAIAHYGVIVTFPPKKVASIEASAVTVASTPTTRRNARIIAQTLFNSSSLRI